MVLIDYSHWVVALVCLNSAAISNAQNQYPNPFAQQPAQAAPAAAKQPLTSTGATAQPSAYPNPFASSQGGGAGGATAPPSAYPNPFASSQGGGSQGAGGAGAAAQPSAYPNPFASSQGGGGQGAGGAGAAAQPSTNPNPFAAPVSGATGGASVSAPLSPASLDPSNAAGTCCCDSKKTFQAAATPQAPGGCCAAGNKWGCSCQDGGSFLHNPLSCPVLHRNTRITPSGPRFELFCNVQTHRKDLKVDHADSFLDCVDACGATDGCVGVDFAKTTQQCYYKSEYMDENTTGAVNNDIDSASMPPLTCPDINGQVRNIGGVPFKLSCDKPVTTSTWVLQPGANTVDACTQACASQPTCQGMNFRASDQGCYLHSAYQNPPLGTETGWLTMIPVTQR